MRGKYRRSPDSGLQQLTLASGYDFLRNRELLNGNMLWTIATILLALWLVGLSSAHTLAGFLHVLLVVAVVLVLFNLVVGRRPL
jgi:hypothetical protein